MNNRFSITAIVLVSLVACWGNTAAAQDFEAVSGRNLWNSGDNVTGIAQDSTSVSYAEIYAGGKSGGFHSYGDAS